MLLLTKNVVLYQAVKLIKYCRLKRMLCPNSNENFKVCYMIYIMKNVFLNHAELLLSNYNKMLIFKQYSIVHRSYIYEFLSTKIVF